MNTRWYLRLLASRVRMPLTALGLVALFTVSVLDAEAWVRLGGIVVFAGGMLLYTRLGTPKGEAVRVEPPVRGRWRASNSPESNVPSHGVHAWSQTYAIDLVADPEDGSKPSFGFWPPARRPESFPAFGEPILAPIEGEVVRAQGAMRDHLSRTSPFGIIYFILESVREIAGPPGVMGNHVVIRRDDGRCVALAHLQQGSLEVEKGDHVERGDLIGRCGNSGNSTEPHLHLQAMDQPSVWTAAGLPLRFSSQRIPENGEAVRFEPARG